MSAGSGAGAPVVVMVEPQLGENIGTAARAMANFGLADLRLVHPRDGWPNPRAIAAASGASHVVDRVAVFDTLGEAIADLGLVYATTARTRGLPKAVRDPKAAVARLRAEAGQGTRTGLLFGRERIGLTNEEVGLADEIVTFPVDPRFASLNVAQAVLLMGYEWISSGLAEGELPTRTAIPERAAPPASKEDVLALLVHLEGVLDRAGYFRTPEKKPVQVANLRALLQRPAWTEPEVKTLRGVVAAFERVGGGEAGDG